MTLFGNSIASMPCRDPNCRVDISQWHILPIAKGHLGAAKITLTATRLSYENLAGSMECSLGVRYGGSISESFQHFHFRNVPASDFRQSQCHIIKSGCIHGAHAAQMGDVPS